MEKILKKHNTTHVRAKHLFHKQKQHKGWADKQVTELWADLMYVIQERDMFAGKTYLFEDDYKPFLPCQTDHPGANALRASSTRLWRHPGFWPSGVGSN